MSRRLGSIYRDWAPEVETYSIDESFLGLDHISSGHRVAYAHDLRSTVAQWTGIPTCVGIGPTKTLAKLANHIAKKNGELGGVCDLGPEEARRNWLGRVGMEEVWGIGSAAQARLAEIGIETVADLAAQPARRIRQMLTVTGEKTVRELQGISCLDLELIPPRRQGCAVTRSFGRPVSTQEEMLEAVATHASRLGEKLRTHGMETGDILVFMHTSPYRGGPAHSASRSVRLPDPTCDTRELVAAARRAATAIYRPGIAYAKAGVIASDLLPIGDAQPPLWGARDRARSSALMEALDTINARMGRGTIGSAAAGTRREWQTRAERRSPRYTTRIDELPIVRA